VTIIWEVFTTSGKLKLPALRHGPISIRARGIPVKPTAKLPAISTPEKILLSGVDHVLGAVAASNRFTQRSLPYFGLDEFGKFP
jgi:hypothetical protein